MAYRCGPKKPVIHTVAELGPGNSLGTGLAALISGANTYYALDVVKRANHSLNVAIFDDLITLFDNQEKIPGENEFPDIKPYLESYEFPEDILSSAHLKSCLKEGRIESIRNALIHLDQYNDQTQHISYIVPWHDPGILDESSVDMIFSQAVLEHVDDLYFTYQTLYRWLKPGGLMSHQIDFKSHGTAEKWNGHWGYSNITWRIIVGNRTHFLNRHVHSTHIDLLNRLNFKVSCDVTTKDTLGLDRDKLASGFRDMGDDDLITSGAFIQAIKNHH